MSNILYTMELMSGNYNTLHCNVLVKLNGLELVKRTLQNTVSNFLLCWTFVILNYPAFKLTSYVWGIPYFWVLVGTETDQNSLLQENWFPGLPWSRPRFIAWLASIICAFPGFESSLAGNGWGARSFKFSGPWRLRCGLQHPISAPWAVLGGPQLK